MYKNTREMMKDAADPLRYYDGVKQLLKQDTSGMDQLSQLPMPAYRYRNYPDLLNLEIDITIMMLY